MKIILIMGLPGAGKTTLADELAPMVNAKRLNADEVRKAADDWDFSPVELYSPPPMDFSKIVKTLSQEASDCLNL